MVRYGKCLFLSIAFLSIGTLCPAAEGGSLCALFNAYDCTEQEGCQQTSLEQMSLPRFVTIDLQEKVISAVDSSLSRTTPISSINELEGMTMLQGIEIRGWSIALGKESGKLTLSAAGDGEGFIVFGACPPEGFDH